MKKLMLLTFIGMLLGCSKKNPDGTYTPSSSIYNVYIIDSCEYIGALDGGSLYIAHKGNCRFCIERRKQELKELIKKEDSV